jgi:chemotaxis family two-component system response regulator Rcp1
MLLVEDSPRDVRLMREALRDLGLDCVLQVAADGFEALAMLRHKPPHQHVGHPDLVLLDINLPALSGIDVLREIKSDSALRDLPVLMLSTSAADSDIRSSYALAADSYLVKPADFEEFTRMIAAIHDYWMQQSRPTPRRVPRDAWPRSQ